MRGAAQLFYEGLNNQTNPDISFLSTDALVFLPEGISRTKIRLKPWTSDVVASENQIFDISTHLPTPESIISGEVIPNENYQVITREGQMVKPTIL